MMTLSSSPNANATLEESRSTTNAFIGEVKAWAGFRLPDGFLWCDGTLKSGAADSGFNALALAIGFGYGATLAGGTITFTENSAELSCTVPHGLSVGDVISIQGGSGLLGGEVPPGVYPHRAPFIVASVLSTTVFTVSDYMGGGELVSGASVSNREWYDEFAVPDLRDRQIIGRGDMGGSSAGIIEDTLTNALGITGGAEKHTEVPLHDHILSANSAGSASGGAARLNNLTNGNSGSDDATTSATGISGGVNHIDPFQVLNYIIRYR